MADAEYFRNEGFCTHVLGFHPPMFSRKEQSII